MLAPTVVASHGYDLWLALSTSCGSSGLIRWDIFGPQKIVSGKRLLPPSDCRALFRRDVRTSRLRDDATSQTQRKCNPKNLSGRRHAFATMGACGAPLCHPFASQLGPRRFHRPVGLNRLVKRTRRRLFRGEPLTNLRSVSLSLTVSRTGLRRSAKTDPRPLVRRLFNHARDFSTCSE